MLAGELALAGLDVAIVERRPSQDLAGTRASMSVDCWGEDDALGLPSFASSKGNTRRVGRKAQIERPFRVLRTTHEIGRAYCVFISD